MRTNKAGAHPSGGAPFAALIFAALASYQNCSPVQFQQTSQNALAQASREPASALPDAAPASLASFAVTGTVFNDLNKNGAWDKASVTAGPAPQIAGDVVIRAPFDQSYQAFDLGNIPGVPAAYGGLIFKPGDANRIWIGGDANQTSSGGFYEAQLVRNAKGQITGFSGAARKIIDAQAIDGGLTQLSSGVFAYVGFPVANLYQFRAGDAQPTKIDPYGSFISGVGGALEVVPAGFPGAGRLKWLSWSGGVWADFPLVFNALGYLNLQAPTKTLSIGTSSEGFQYLPAGSPGIPNQALIVSDWSEGTISLYNVDGNGDPLVGSRRIFANLSGAEGALFDPVTGDFVFSTYGSGNHVVIIRGFTSTTTNAVERGLAGWIVFCDFDGDGSPDANEPWSKTNASGEYSLQASAACPIRLRAQDGWVTTTAASAPIQSAGQQNVGAAAISN